MAKKNISADSSELDKIFAKLIDDQNKLVPNSAASATSTTLHVCNLDSVPILPSEQKYWLENSTGVTVNAGWKLTVVPKSFVPG